MGSGAFTDRELVKKCMAELSEKAGMQNANPVQRELEYICERIESVTGVLISLSTMKRLFNGQFSRQPQVATLNALTMYLGYQNWQHFRQAKIKELIPTNTGNDNRGQKPVRAARRFGFMKYILVPGMLVFTAVSTFAFLKFNKPKTGNFEKAGFSMKKTTGNDLPNTVVFNYNLDGVVADSFFIQQSWDKERRVRIDPKNHTLTDIYYEPGYHVAKLIANDQVIKTIDVSIPTDRWFFYAKQRKPGSLPEYISFSGQNDGSMRMTKDEVSKSNIDIQKEYVYLQVYFPTDIRYSSDNYVLKCRARITELKNNFCPFLMCEVFCQKNFMFFKSTTKGCTSEAKLQFGENILSGKTTDLSNLGTDVREWHDIEIRVKDKSFVIRIGDAAVFSGAYTESSGMITGMGFLSNGLPEVEFVSLETLDGKKIYSNDFDK